MKTEDKDVETPTKAEDKDIEAPTKAGDKDVETPSKAEDKDVETPMKVDDKDVEAPTKVEENDVETPSKVDKNEIPTEAEDKNLETSFISIDGDFDDCLMFAKDRVSIIDTDITSHSDVKGKLIYLKVGLIYVLFLKYLEV